MLKSLLKFQNKLNKKFILQPMKYESNLRKYLSEKGYDPIYGARPLKRVIQREVENFLANKILKNEISTEKKVIVDVDGENLIMK